MLIVEDPPGYLPDQIANMPEIPMMIQHLHLEELFKYANQSGLTWFDYQNIQIDYTNATSESGNTNMMLVNMQYIPKITVEKGKWYRLRMVMSSVLDGLAWTAPPGCDLMLLAKDGIYLQDAPRSVSTMILAPGNRADVAIRCNIDPGIYKMPTVSRGQYFEPISPNDLGFDVPATCGFCGTQPYVAALKVVAGSGEPEPDLKPFGAELERPCYLTDLTQVPDDEIGEQFDIDYGYGLCFTVNGVCWNASFSRNYSLGTVQQSYLVNNGVHPHHQRKPQYFQLIIIRIP